MSNECADNGTCHHECPLIHGKGNPCFRVLTAGPLSGVFPGDKWPKYVMAQHEHSEAVRIALNVLQDDEPTVAFTKAEVLARIDRVEADLLSKVDSMELYSGEMKFYDVDDVVAMFHALRESLTKED